MIEDEDYDELDDVDADAGLIDASLIEPSDDEHGDHALVTLNFDSSSTTKPSQ